MYIKKFNENLDNNVLVCVDIQEEYEDVFSFKINDFTAFLNNYQNTIYYIYNGEDMGGPTENQLKYWLEENGVNEEKLYDIIFLDKEYGFLRPYMDSYSDRDGLIELLKYMINNNIIHSVDISSDEFDNFNNSDIKDFLMSYDMIILDYKAFKIAKTIPNNFNLCGGGQFECLKEMDIVFDISNKKYNKINKYIY